MEDRAGFSVLFIIKKQLGILFRVGLCNLRCFGLILYNYLFGVNICLTAAKPLT